MKILRSITYILIGILIIYSLYLAATPALTKEVNFFNDVARDFLLLQELDQKKIVLIGPRSSTTGLFHGPLLTYVDYPAYLIGNGNPVTVTWFWFFISIVFLITSFFIAKKFFGVFPALVFILLASLKMVPHINGVFEPEAMYFVMPFFLFSIFSYAQTKNLKYLILHCIALSIFIQLSIGIGLQFLILSLFTTGFIIFRSKKWKHLLAFSIIPLGTINFIIFDLRHGMQMTKALFGTGGSTGFFISIQDWITNRIENTIHMQLLEKSNLYMPLLVLIFLFIMLGSAIEIKKNKKLRPVYLLFLFYYFGYLILSYFNKGILLFHYIYLLTPFSLLWVTSFLRGKYLKVFLPVCVILVYLNLNSSIDYVKSLSSFTNKNQYSWVGLSNTALEVLSMQNGKEFGYFVFSPDSFAYQPRYAMLYHLQKNGGHEYKKMETTYIIAAPPPADDPYMDYKWWVKVPVGIEAEPEVIKKMPNGYTILKYKLTPEDQKIPHDKAIELGIHFR